MAHKKGLGASKNGRDSNPQHFGVKIYGGEKINHGSIIIRQKGTRFKAGLNVGMGRDYTLFSKIDGVVKFEGSRGVGQKVSVYPAS